MTEDHSATNNMANRQSNKRRGVELTVRFIDGLSCVVIITQKYEQCDWLLATLYFPSQQVSTCSKLTIETLEQGVKYVQS